MLKKTFSIDRMKVGLMVAIFGFALVATLVVVKAYSGGAPKVVVEGNYIEASGSNAGNVQFGAVGAQLVEDYIPAIKFNDGYNSVLDITTTGTLTVTTLVSAGTINLTGTSTISNSYDGFVIQPTVSYATGTPNALYTNTTGKAMMCRGGGVYADSLSASLGRNFKVSMGTSTGVVGAGTNLLSTSTVATTTDTFLGLTFTQSFALANGESIITLFADADANASSTYFTSTYWRVQPAVNCTLLGQ